MCWNAEVSIQSFGIGMVGILVAVMTGTSFPMILFYTTIVFMQFVEYIVWTYGADPNTNFYASLGGAGLLALQPIASILAIAPAIYKTPLLISYLILGLISQIIDHRSDHRSFHDRYRIERGEHLIWKWLDPVPRFSLLIYFIFLIGPLLLSKQYEFVALVMVTLVFSVYAYGKGNTWGSMWCWIVNWMVVFICLKNVL